MDLAIIKEQTIVEMLLEGAPSPEEFCQLVMSALSAVRDEPPWPEHWHAVVPWGNRVYTLGLVGRAEKKSKQYFHRNIRLSATHPGLSTVAEEQAESSHGHAERHLQD